MRVCGLPLDLCLLPSLGQAALEIGAEIRRLRPTPSGVYSLRSRWISDEDDPLTVLSQCSDRFGDCRCDCAGHAGSRADTLTARRLRRGGAGYDRIPGGRPPDRDAGLTACCYQLEQLSIGDQKRVTLSCSPTQAQPFSTGSQATYLRRLRDGCRPMASLLVNPNGIAITPTGTVDVSGLSHRL